VNLLAVLLWSVSTDAFGRRTIINTCQTLVCVILFICGGLYWTGATTGNAAAGTGLVCFLAFHHLVFYSSCRDLIWLTNALVGYLLRLDFRGADHYYVVLPLLG
jgi:hypothetical protein